MPMLDESEYSEVLRVYRECARATKEFRQQWNVSLKEASLEERFRPLRTRYEEITGYRETNHNAIMHHRLSRYGPPCKHCGKPLRTPKAKLCGACTAPVQI
jgi:hypothetical protein